MAKPDPSNSPGWLDGHRVRLQPVERDSIVGIGHVMVEVEALLARLRDPARAAALGVSPPRGVSCCTASPASARPSWPATSRPPSIESIPFFEVGSDELTPSRSRACSHHLAETYDRCVLYIDEIDQWATSRTSPYHSPGTRLLSPPRWQPSTASRATQAPS